MRAVVFAYHNVGVRCLKVLLAKGLDVPLVVTHDDDQAETIWFDSVKRTCADYGIRAIMPADPRAAELFLEVQQVRPDYLFSFYYRHMLPSQLMGLARHGAFNMHGSLLPKYRGRAPVNWAVLNGETETGATLHEMNEKPDAGSIVAQTRVPILPDDTAYEVFGKVTVAAEQTLWQALPELLSGKAKLQPNDISKGSYFGRRTPEDGKIDWRQSAQTIYNLHRAVAPPYPGAWTLVRGQALTLAKARLTELKLPGMSPGLSVMDNQILGVGGDHRVIRIHELLIDGKPISPEELKRILAES